MLTENYLVRAIKLIQSVLCGTARKILRTLKKIPPSNEIRASVNTLDSITPLIDRLMRIVPFEEIKETKDY